MSCNTPQQLLMNALQALSLPADAFWNYLPEGSMPVKIIYEFRHWLDILHGRDDWMPTPEQQTELQRVDEAASNVEEPRLPDNFRGSIEEQVVKHLDVAYRILSAPGWTMLRESCQQALLAFDWPIDYPKEHYGKSWQNINNFSVDMPVYERLLQARRHFEAVRRRPSVFCGDDVPSYLDGFTYALSFMLAPLCISFSEYEQILNSRGWKATARGPLPDMERRNWSQQAIFDELICIEIDEIGLLVEKITEHS